jgi:DNA helicase-2/ATP-dependent DNA helicase PcrA
MPSASRIVICAAGGGKTTRIVADAVSVLGGRVLLVTYTRNNQRELKDRLYRHGPVIPSNIEVMTWFGFLLRELARPYQRTMHSQRIESISFVDGISAPYIPESKTSKHYFLDDRYIYSDKIAKFILECDRRSTGAVMRRLAMRFDHIFLDEVQDIAGYDLDLLELILKTGIRMTLVGDHRQATFATNHGKKNKAFAGIKVIEKFRAWQKSGLAGVAYEQHTHRCNQLIADLSDTLFPQEPKTTSLNCTRTGHDGIFIVRTDQVETYVAKYSPKILRLDRRTNCSGLDATNFGDSKGLTFDRVLVFPHGLAQKWLATGSVTHIEKSLAKMYVGITRAKYSLAFVFDRSVAIPGAVSLGEG